MMSPDNGTVGEPEPLTTAETSASNLEIAGSISAGPIHGLSGTKATLFIG